MRLRIGALLFATTIGACDKPARIVAGNGDTVVINARRAVHLPVRILDGDGDVMKKRDVRFEITSGTALRALGGDSLRCDGRGDASLRMTIGPVSSSVIVLCRPTLALRIPWVIDLVQNGKPQTLALGGIDERGAEVSEIAVGVTVNDSTVAVFRGGQVHPRRPGWTYLLIDKGDCRVAINVRVHDPNPAADTARPPYMWMRSPAARSVRLFSNQ